MAITITNTSALIATHYLDRNQANLQTTLQRLATGYRINSGKDDPAGLMASEFLRSQIASTNAAIGNAQRADQVLATAEGALSKVSDLLINLQSLVTQSANTAGLSADAIDANQVQADSIIQTIDRIAGATSFAGTTLLDGSLSYTTSGGPNSSSLLGLNIYAAKIDHGSQAVTVHLLASAQHATLIAHGQITGLTSATTITLTGNNGIINLSFASGTHASAIAFSVNRFSDATGVLASANTTDVAFSSLDYGASQFVSVQSTSNNFQTENIAGINADKNTGRDAQVTLNGQLVTAKGLNIKSDTEALDLSFQLDPAFNKTGNTAQFTIIGGGATFSMDPQLNSTFSVGLGQIDTNQLGFTTLPNSSDPYSLRDLLSNGKASLTSNNLTTAQQIVHSAINSVADTRARIGAYRSYDIQSTINSLNVQVENLSSAESQIRDTDFAAETAALAREQILAQSSQFALGAAEQSQQLILKLLGP